jgi:aldehyde reductase
MKFVTLPDGEPVPALGLGTWRMGERRGARAEEAAVLRAGIEAGLTLIDTAEMYGEGGAEEVVAEAVAGRRKDVFIVSKVYPHNASFARAIAACERSLKRLKTESIDLYLLHWRGSVPLSETVEAFEQLRRDGKIRCWGVSNFDVGDMEELLSLPQGENCAANQVFYHLGSRGIEWRLLPWLQEKGIAVMAYSPLGQGSILRSPALIEVARSRGIRPATAALAWVLRQPGVIAIPKTARQERIREITAALDIELDKSDLARLDRAFPPPTKATPLATT